MSNKTGWNHCDWKKVQTDTNLILNESEFDIIQNLQGLRSPLFYKLIEHFFVSTIFSSNSSDLNTLIENIACSKNNNKSHAVPSGDARYTYLDKDISVDLHFHFHLILDHWSIHWGPLMMSQKENLMETPKNPMGVS